MNAPGKIALRAVEDAIVNVGVQEVGNNRGKWVETYLRFVGAHPGDSWCAAFVAYRIWTAAKGLIHSIPVEFPKSAWTPHYAAWAKAQNLWLPKVRIEEARRGDLCCFYFEGKGRIAHIGIVTEVGPGNTFHSVEGNTSPDNKTVNRDGDGVYRKMRKVSALGKYGGFVRLPF